MLAWVMCLAAAGPQPIDPFLPHRLRPVVQEAVTAELDPKRGPRNAMQILEDAQATARDEQDRLRLKLRAAAIQVRDGFMTKSEADEPTRLQQALTTFTRLDVAEPGYAQWLQRVLEANPEARKALEAAEPLRLAVLTRQGLPGPEIESRLESLVESLGIQVEVRDPSDAEMVVSVRAENQDSPDPSQVAIRTVVDVRRLADGETQWKTRLGQTSVAPSPDIALGASLEWTVRMGGREMLSRWLGVHGLPLMIEGPMGAGAVPGMSGEAHGHEGHGH